MHISDIKKIIYNITKCECPNCGTFTDEIKVHRTQKYGYLFLKNLRKVR